MSDILTYGGNIPKEVIIQDVIIALNFLIQTLTDNDIDDLAEILKDVLYVYLNTHNNYLGKEIEEKEYISLINYYIVLKYYNKITLDKYKEKVASFIREEIKNEEK